MELYGIIGNPLGHSFSRTYFTELFARTGRDACYVPYELRSAGELMALVTIHPNLVGLNVTIPFKQTVIPYLNAIDPTAARIGAVNVIKAEQKPGCTWLKGYNTDVIGFSRSIGPLLQPHHTRALVLGTGGASLAVHYALRELGVASTAVSRTPKDGQLGYGDLTEEVLRSHTVIVNATPLGTTPDTGSCPAIPYDLLTPRHLCFDLVYNPDKTLFLSKAEAHGATIRNGLEMLYIQADEAWKIWNE